MGETVTRTIDYIYDPLYRLTSADSTDGDLFVYTYDATGNRLTETTPGNVTSSYIYDNAQPQAYWIGSCYAIISVDDSIKTSIGAFWMYVVNINNQTFLPTILND